MVVVLAVVASAAAVRAVGNRFYGGADGAVGQLMAVKPGEYSAVGVVAAVAAAEAPEGGEQR
jgi:hypothetical protein